jgi:hypothetical protein
MGESMSVNHIVTEAMYKYDHNKNGVIDLARPDGGIWNRMKNPDERVRSITQVNSFQQDQLTISSSVHTMADLFYAANRNGDKQVTREELMAEVQKFDKNGDGGMTSRGFGGWLKSIFNAKGNPKQELDLFNDQYKERMTNYGSVDI